MAALVQIPNMNLVTVLASQQQLRVDAIFHHVRSAPFRRDHRVVSEVPPEIVSQLLGATILFPRPFQLKGVRVHQENASGTVSASRTEGASVDRVRSTMKGVRRRVAGLLDELFGFDHLYNLRLLGIGLRIKNVNPG